ncbi:MAG TPA: flagellar hook-length control protein FliK [Ilumatobacter sp.]|nr:flagellar hook-length control protein FliK [Ilumatobacter sp.]
MHRDSADDAADAHRTDVAPAPVVASVAALIVATADVQPVEFSVATDAVSDFADASVPSPSDATGMAGAATAPPTPQPVAAVELATHLDAEPALGAAADAVAAPTDLADPPGGSVTEVRQPLPTAGTTVTVAPAPVPPGDLAGEAPPALAAPDAEPPATVRTPVIATDDDLAPTTPDAAAEAVEAAPPTEAAARPEPAAERGPADAPVAVVAPANAALRSAATANQPAPVAPAAIPVVEPDDVLGRAELNRLAGGTQRVDVELDTASLGRVRVEAVDQRGAVSIQIHADRPEARALLDEQLGGLHTDLANPGGADVRQGARDRGPAALQRGPAADVAELPVATRPTPGTRPASALDRGVDLYA